MFALPLPLSKFHFLNADLSVNAVLAVLVREDIFAYHFSYILFFTFSPVFVILDTLVHTGRITNPMSSKRSFPYVVCLPCALVMFMCNLETCQPLSTVTSRRCHQGLPCHCHKVSVPTCSCKGISPHYAQTKWDAFYLAYVAGALRLAFRQVTVHRYKPFQAPPR